MSRATDRSPAAPPALPADEPARVLRGLRARSGRVRAGAVAR
jgi:hypothetical protein